jgi:hypothetical protein
MERDKFHSAVFLVDEAWTRQKHLGSAFVVAPNSGLLTCRHVVDVDYDRSTQFIVVADFEKDKLVKVEEPILSDDELDMAFIPEAFQRTKNEFIPILTPEKLLVGESVYSTGYYALGGQVDRMTFSYFSGSIVNFFNAGNAQSIPAFTLPYPNIEGMSGGPVLTYHNGTKLVGMAFGNQSQRVIASEVLDYKNTKREYTETIHRIVEFGLAYHAATIAQFLDKIGVTEAVVSDQRLDIEGLE